MGLDYYCDIQIKDDEHTSQVLRFELKLSQRKSIAELDSSELEELKKIVLIRSWEMLGTVGLRVRFGYWTILWLKLKDLFFFWFYLGILSGITSLLDRLLSRLLGDRYNGD
jgi:hypothetical protein